jgi:hypothetical protein
MVKRRQPAAKPRATVSGNRAGLVPLLILFASGVCTVIGAVRLHAIWTKLPGNSLARVDWQGVNRARAGLTGAAREGLLLVVNSEQFTSAFQGRADLAAALGDVRTRALQLPNTQVGRVQIAALAMLQFDRGGLLRGQWWPKLRGYLEGLDRADFDHFLPELIRAETAIREQYGLGPGTAQRTALRAVGQAHGPFLQYFVEQALRLSGDCRRSGDAEAAACLERIVHRLLRRWALSSGPANLRLLAAELLADSRDGFQPEQPASGPVARSPDSYRPAGVVDAKLAQKCRAWLSEYRQRAADLPAVPPLLRVGDEPASNPGEPALARWLALTAWTASALVPVGLAALLAGVFWIKAGAVGRHAMGHRVLAGLPAVLILIVGWLLTSHATELVYNDLRRAGSENLGWPRLPLIAAAVGIGATAAGALIGGGQRGIWRRWLERLGRSAGFTWLLLSILLIAMSVETERRRADCERTLAYPLDEQLQAIADPNANGLLDDLRGWNP